MPPALTGVRASPDELKCEVLRNGTQGSKHFPCCLTRPTSRAQTPTTTLTCVDGTVPTTHTTHKVSALLVGHGCSLPFLNNVQANLFAFTALEMEPHRSRPFLTGTFDPSVFIEATIETPRIQFQLCCLDYQAS